MFQSLLALLAGSIQGLTEFLPVSSSGHLVLFHDFLNFDLPDDVAFDVVLHLGTFVSLLVFFWRDIIVYIKAFFQSIVSWNVAHDLNQRLAWQLALATIPAGVVGVLWEDIIDQAFRNASLVAVMLIFFGCLLFWADWYFKKQKSLETVTFTGALVIGFAQVLALIPGVSRSGITIIAGLSQNLNRQSAARFSFLLSMPIVVAAGAKKMFDLLTGPALVPGEGTVLLIGFASSAIVGYVCIKYFLKFLQSHSLAIFAYYRIALGVIVLLALFGR